jgi:hypothetical protein
LLLFVGVTIVKSMDMLYLGKCGCSVFALH